MKSKTIELKTKHLFKVLTIVRKTGVLKELKDVLLNSSGENISKEDLEKIQSEVGFDVAILILESLDKAESEIYSLLADLDGKTVKEIEEQDPVETIETIKQIINSKAVQGFLKQATA